MGMRGLFIRKQICSVNTQTRQILADNSQMKVNYAMTCFAESLAEKELKNKTR